MFKLNNEFKWAGILLACLTFISWNEKRPVITNWVMDIMANNYSSTTVDYVRYQSSVETKTFYNVDVNGDGSTLEWVIEEGFGVTVKMPAYPGTGTIKLFHGSTQLAGMNFINASTSLTYTFWDDFSGVYFWGVRVEIRN